MKNNTCSIGMTTMIKYTKDTKYMYVHLNK